MATAGSVSVHIEGLEKLREKFDELSDKQQRGVLRAGIRAGGRVVERKAKSLVHVESGNLRKAIKTKVSVKARSTAEADIGWDPKIAPHGHLVELGHAQVVGKRGSGRQRKIGHVPAHPFLRPALEGSQHEVIETIADNFRKHIEKVAAK